MMAVLFYAAKEKVQIVTIMDGMELYVPIVLTISVVRVARHGGARVDENPRRRLCDPSPDTAAVERPPVRVYSCSRVVGVGVLGGGDRGGGGGVVDETLGIEDGRDEPLGLLLPRHGAEVLLLLLLLLLQRGRR